jgi:hypothetical protein
MFTFKLFCILLSYFFCRKVCGDEIKNYICRTLIILKQHNMKSLTFLSANQKVVNVIALNKTKNGKITTPNKLILQTYHFDIEQINFAKQGGKGINLDTGFLNPKLTENNCLSCPLRFGGCYTHHGIQPVGHLSMLRRLAKLDKIPQYSVDTINQSLAMLQLTTNKYIRFGSYGCPTNLPFNLVQLLAENANNYTGYTHEWHNPKNYKYMAYFMASTHQSDPIFSSKLANDLGFRTFEIDGKVNTVQCPHSTNKDIKCDKCGLCSGYKGKGKTNIGIPKH